MFIAMNRFRSRHRPRISSGCPSDAQCVIRFDETLLSASVRSENREQSSQLSYGGRRRDDGGCRHAVVWGNKMTGLPPVGAAPAAMVAEISFLVSAIATASSPGKPTNHQVYGITPASTTHSMEGTRRSG